MLFVVCGLWVVSCLLDGLRVVCVSLFVVRCLGFDVCLLFVCCLFVVCLLYVCCVWLFVVACCLLAGLLCVRC